jgi:hypothetical protein
MLFGQPKQKFKESAEAEFVPSPRHNTDVVRSLLLACRVTLRVCQPVNQVCKVSDFTRLLCHTKGFSTFGASA